MSLPHFTTQSGNIWGESPTKEGEGAAEARNQPSGKARLPFVSAFVSASFAIAASCPDYLSYPLRPHQLGTFGYRQDTRNPDGRGLTQTPLAPKHSLTLARGGDTHAAPPTEWAGGVL